MTNKKALKITIGQIFEILKRKRLLTFSSKNFDSVSFDHDISLFFHSIEVMSFLSNVHSFFEKPQFAYVVRNGKSFNGYQILADVLQSKNIFIGEWEKSLASLNQGKMPDDCYFIGVSNTEVALNEIIKSIYGISVESMKLIGVTGTNGKTSVVQILSQMIETIEKKTVMRIGTLGIQIQDDVLPGSHVTTPDFPTLMHALDIAKKRNISTVVMEVTSHGLSEKRLHDLNVDIAIFTNLTLDHLDYHGSMENYRIAKLKLFNETLSKTGFAIVHTDQDESLAFVRAAAFQQMRNLILVGHEEDVKKNLESTVKEGLLTCFQTVQCLVLSTCKTDLNGIVASVKHFNCAFQLIDECAFQSSLLGDFQVENALCAIGACLALSFPLSLACESMEKVKSIPGRLDVVELPLKNKTPKVIVDYAHTPAALEKVIATCRNLLAKEGKIITVFGCGGNRDSSKRPEMGFVASDLSDFVFITSDNPRDENPEKIIYDIVLGISKRNYITEPDRKQAIRLAMDYACKDDLVLICGKGHENYQIIGDTKYPFSDADAVKSIFFEEDHLK